MKYYKHPETGEVFAHENDQERQEWGAPELVEMTPEEIDAHLNPPPAPEQIIAQYTAAVQKHLDDFARTRGYDGILSAATYATSTVPKFKAEGQYAVEARDATWAKCYEVLAAVEAGSRPMPTLDELLAELPVLTWPN